MGDINRAVTKLVDPPKAVKFEAHFINATEIMELLNGLKGNDIFLPTLIAVTMGLRRGEVLGLKWSDIDFDEGSLTVNRTLTPVKGGYELEKTKTEKSNRTIMIPSNVIPYLKEAKTEQAKNKLFFGKGYQNNDFVVSNVDGSAMSPTAWNHRFKRYLDNNNLSDLRLHDLRHSNASLMLKAGVQLKVVSEWLGHSKIGTTADIYVHIDKEQMSSAAERINNAIDI